MGGEDRGLIIGVLIHDLSLGGSERIALRLAASWAAVGRRIILLVGDTQGSLATLIPDAVEVRTPATPIRKHKGSVRALGRWAGHVAAEVGCDILFVPGNWHFRAIGPLRRALGGNAAIVAKLSNAIGRRDRKGLAGLLRRRTLRRLLAPADRVVAMSSELARDAEAVVAPARLTIIPSPVLDSAPATKALPDRPVDSLLVLARLVPQKNVALALHAYARLSDTTLPLVIAGDGAERASLEALAGSLLVADRVRFIGWVADARQVLEQARLLVLPSAYEGFPAVAVEALAAGVPVVATDCSPAMAEIISTPEAGRIVDHDAAALADAITSMLAAPAPDRHRLADLVSSYRMDDVAGRYLTMFEALRA